jgi:WD40 repeat protein
MSHTWLAKLIGCVTLSVVLSAGGLSTRATVPTTATTSGLASHRTAARATLSLSARHDRRTLPGRRTTRGPAARGYVRATARATIVVGACCASRVSWSPTSTMLASGSLDKTVRVWSARGQALATLTGQRGGIYSVAWSPDGKTLASAGWDGTVRLWTIR